jgi:hypothetical protein
LAELSTSKLGTINNDQKKIEVTVAATGKASFLSGTKADFAKGEALGASVGGVLDSVTVTDTSVTDAIANTYITSIGAPPPLGNNVTQWLAGSKNIPMPITYELKKIHDILNYPAFIHKLTELKLNTAMIHANLDKAYKSFCLYLLEKKEVSDCDPEVPTLTTEHYTEWKPVLKTHIKELENHDIDCPDHSAIHYFKLQWTKSRDKNKNYWRFQFLCTKSDKISLDECVKGQTMTKLVENTEDLSSLADHPIKCAAGYVLNQFRYEWQKDGQKYGHFVYDCCKAKVEATNTIVKNAVYNKKNQIEENLNELPKPASEDDVLSEITFHDASAPVISKYVKLERKTKASADAMIKKKLR